MAATAHALQGHALLGLQRMRPFLLQPFLILQQRHHLLHLLPDVDALVLAVTVHILEVLQCLDGVEVLPALVGHFLGASFDEVVQKGEGFVDMTPVLATVVQPPPDHAHDLGKSHCVEGEVGDL